MSLFLCLSCISLWLYRQKELSKMAVKRMAGGGGKEGGFERKKDFEKMKRRGGGLAIERVSIEGWGGFKPSAHNQGILLEYETLTSFLIFIKIDLLRAQICKKMF